MPPVQLRGCNRRVQATQESPACARRSLWYVAATPYDARHSRAIPVDVLFVSSYWTKVDDGLKR